jgi:hypothetical protein
LHCTRRPCQPATRAIAITVNGTTVGKNLLIGAGIPALSNKKMAVSGWEHFIYPVEQMLKPQTPVRFIAIQYPPRTISLLGFKAHWLIFYMALTMVMALALKNKFGVEF